MDRPRLKQTTNHIFDGRTIIGKRHAESGLWLLNGAHAAYLLSFLSLPKPYIWCSTEDFRQALKNGGDEMVAQYVARKMRGV